ncbi:PREDICTED: putative uncharacterized protein DDB_G0294196 [Nicrophorus vespilloides]|uniref:Uncharacterized protein n=1 Tax=Nicrophorus vespilloides TaxID=110193 RepID=A0ABM1M036_NICVS|nr:PREDICTED: putative uncharacterized protein DDB_G0294196 [Nicrophorus vespilloides]
MIVAEILSILSVALCVQALVNPTILQDSRDLPKLDGTFGFLYRTEDGIAHAAKADPGGIVHGRFTYTDPTGLKVNYNYNAGSSVTPKYNYNAPIQQQQQQQQQPQQYQQNQDYDQDQDYQQPEQPIYQQPQQQRAPVYQRPQQQQAPNYEERRTKPPGLRSNNNNYDNNVNNYNV